MRRSLILFSAVLFPYFSGISQTLVVKGQVVDSDSNDPIPDVEVIIYDSKFLSVSDPKGFFEITDVDIPVGEQVLVVSKLGYKSKRMAIIIQIDKPVEIIPLLLEIDLRSLDQRIGLISLSENELDEDEGTSYSIAGLLQSSRDVFLNAASFDFSTTFFRPRGYDSKNGKVLINGLEMNKLYDGRPQWANWGGLNDAQRNQMFSMGISANEYNFGDLAGTVNIIMRASQYRRGGRVSYASSNRSYRGRVLGSYNSGLLRNNWAYSLLLGRRNGEEGFIDGSLYDANSIFVSVERKFTANNAINLTAFYTPNRRGKTSPNTQEVYDLKGMKYNSYWGKQDGEIRNSRIKEVEEPVIMLNHYWNISEKTQLNTNLGYQFGKIGNSRLGYDKAPNPDPSYYQKLPSYFLANKNGPNYEGAYRAYSNFTNDGQIDWQDIYETNIFYAGTSRYYLYEDRTDDKQISANSILTTSFNENIGLTASVSYKSLNSSNFASMKDLLGGNGYLDIDTFNHGDSSQSDLNNPNRIIGKEDRFKYDYEIDASEYNGFVQGQFSYSRTDFYIAAKAGKVSFQRNGLYRNGSFPEDSFGKSKELDYTTYGVKAGANYKISGRQIVEFNSAYFTDAPSIRNSFSNARQNNRTVVNSVSEKNIHSDLSYIFRSPVLKARLTGYYTLLQDASEISFYYADGISGLGRNNTTAFVQEVLTDIDKQNLGAELGLEAQVTPTFKLKAAAAYGQYTYANNPNLYLTSEDFETEMNFGKSYLKNYKVAGGPQRAYQVGFEYRDPEYWWVGVTANYFSNAYINVSPLLRTANFHLDTDGMLYNDYDEDKTRLLLKQEKFDSYMLVNVVGGKSWRIKRYFLGFFATINNALDKQYKTGGFEQARKANYKTLSADMDNEIRVFGPKYWYGYGTTYYVNLYVRF